MPTRTIPPRALRNGDLVRIVSPSWCGAGLFPHRLARGRDALHRLSLRTDVAPNALHVSDYTAGSAEERAADLNGAFSDPEVRGIFCAIGGDHCNQVLPHIDWSAIAADPKPLVGYSDITVLQLAILACTGIRSFYGPTVLTGLAEFPDVFPYTRDSLRTALFTTEPAGVVIPADEWTDEYLEWATKSDTERRRRLTPNAGPRSLRGGAARGQLVGGCLPSIMHLRGTPYWPTLDGAVFFWETPEGGYTASDADSHLTDLRLSGVFDQISAMLIGRPYWYDQAERDELDQVILECTRNWDFPIICDLDFGHTDPVFTLPIGAEIQVEADALQIVLLESGCDE